MVKFSPPADTARALNLRGTPFEDFLSGGSGDDIIRGLAGPDHLHGYTGNDRIFGDDGPDEIKGGFGNDHLEGGAGDDRLWGGKGADYVHGGDGDDKIVGHPDGDTIIGGKGVDVFRFNDWTNGGEASLRMDAADKGVFLQGANSYDLGPITQAGDNFTFDINVQSDAGDSTIHAVIAGAHPSDIDFWVV